MKNMRPFLCLCAFLGLAFGATQAVAASPDYDKLAREKLTAFYLGTLPQSDFSAVSPWRKVFAPANLAQRAPLSLASLDLAEVRLPSNPNGLEAIFTVRFKVTVPVWLGSVRLAAGDYAAVGNMTFYETTRGVLVRDCDFVVMDKSGATVGANYLPWKITNP